MKNLLRWLLFLFYAVAGYFHLTAPDPFLRIMPGWVPAPDMVVMITGLAELAGAAALAQPLNRSLRQAGAMGLAVYALCVWPANINHFAMDMARPDGGWGLAYHIPRMLAQPLIIWATLWSGGLTDWPIRRSR